MAVIEILLGERAPTGVQIPIEYSVLNEDFCTTINGEMVREPVAPLRALFAKLKARDNLLGAVLARLELRPDIESDAVLRRLDRLMDHKKAGDARNDQLCGTLSKIAQGLGLQGEGAMMKPDELTAQVLAMNTELSSALAKAQERAKELEDDARLRAEAQQERGQKLHAMTAADIAISRSAELEAEVRILKSKIGEAELYRIMAEATAAGMRVALQHLERALAGKLRT
jgi:hypothetical protein